MNLIPFESCPDLINAASNGIAVSFILNVDDYELEYQANYYELLEYKSYEKWKSYTILSDIVNMPGHYLMLGKSNRLVSELHEGMIYIDKKDQDLHDYNR